MKPTRSREHLAFVRSLPCAVCLRTNRIEAAHVGSRGMSQKASDLETIPLCWTHHREQHRIGLKKFCLTYFIDLSWLIGQLTAKPRLFTMTVPMELYGSQWDGMYWFAEYRGEVFRLMPYSLGLGESIELAKQVCREYLITTLFRNDSVLRRPGVAARSEDGNTPEVRS